MDAIIFVVGLAIVVTTVLDVFQSVIVPRATGRNFRPSGYLSPWLWRGWVRVAQRVGDAQREDFLSAFAPILLVLLFVYWIGTIVAGYGLIFSTLRDQIKPVPNLLDAMYFAGTTLLTIGYGDLSPTGLAARFFALLAGATGLGAFAISTAFLFAIFGSYQQREAFVVMFSNRVGTPPSGVHFIETYSELNNVEGLVATLRDSQLWLAQVLETHLAYPILTYFRSTHDEISWVAVIGTILDASTLAMTTLDLERAGEATMAYRLGRHLVDDFASHFGLPETTRVGIERDEFDLAYDRLASAKLPLRDRDAAWDGFAKMRATYAGRLNLMASFWRIPPAQWVGDRSFLPHSAPSSER